MNPFKHIPCNLIKRDETRLTEPLAIKVLFGLIQPRLPFVRFHNYPPGLAQHRLHPGHLRDEVGLPTPAVTGEILPALLVPCPCFSPSQQQRKVEIERTDGVDLAPAVFTLSRHKLKRYRVSILRSVEIFIHTFVERFAVSMNAIAELFTGLGSFGVSKLLYALR
jgi:hypothetical protein